MCALGFGCRPRLGKGGPVAFLGLGGEARDLAHPLRFRCGTGFFDRLLTARLGLGFEPRQLAIPLRFRRGDANVRAVWLYSRNDALGNLVVVAAAALVAWTGTRWPDLVAALLIAGLFLRSALSIVRDARADLVAARAS